MEYKPDSEQIRAFIDQLCNESWLGINRRWWPKYVFHFTDIMNAVKILEEKVLWSRDYLEGTDEMPHENASPEIIGQTDSEYKKYVRLYFRPLTPTQYRNEGFRAKRDIERDAHCPFPIYFLFDSKEILTYSNCLFSDGSLARDGQADIGSDYNFLENLPFEEIYHNMWLRDEEKREIIFRRHAEILIEESMPIDSLKHIVCRTRAEKETLLNLLNRQFESELRNSNNLFFGEWTFIQDVDLFDDSIKMKFNPDTNSAGPFNIRYDFLNLETGKDSIIQKDNYFVPKDAINLTLSRKISNYEIRIYIDDHIAYYGIHK
ncbi:MAG: DUF4433 domain-containing protein [candidate division Zixibacteria bacterium]|nr:DUF4433 domain-containing protein [candidate division Zixibacteria bacterium]